MTIEASFRTALDTNILVYLEGLGPDADTAKQRVARDIVDRLPKGTQVIPIQVLGELYRVLRGKRALGTAEAAATVAGWEAISLTPATDWAAFSDALELAGRHGLQIWDAIILAVAGQADCPLLLSEDMQDGFVWRGTTVVNPFAAVPHPLLASLLATLPPLP